MKSYHLLIFVAALVAHSTASAQTISYSNGTFTPGSWTTFVETGAGGSNASSSQAVSGGNPGSYLSVINNSNNEFISTFIFFAGSLFDPSTQGAITSVNLSVDAIRFGPDGQGFAPALRQNGINYLFMPENISFPASWLSVNWSSLTGADFRTWASSSAHPDFSLSGGPIQFGFENTNAATGLIRTTSSGYDNFSVTVNYTAIPEPSTYAALAGLGALGLVVWRGAERGDRPLPEGTSYPMRNGHPFIHTPP